jgi:hypothetical protein
MQIQKGDRVFFKPEYSEPKDAQAVYVAAADAYEGAGGVWKVEIANLADDLGGIFVQRQLINADMLTKEG